MDTKMEDKILSRMEMLLAKTIENGCTEAEAVAAYAKAVELATKYNIDLARAKNDSRLQYEDETVALKSQGFQVRRKQLLIHILAINNFCKVLISINDPDNVTLFGSSVNRKIVKYLYFSIVQQTLDLAKAEFCAQYHREIKIRSRDGISDAWYDSFGIGLAEKLNQRLKKSRDCFEDNPEDRAIVLADDAAMASAFNAAHPCVGRGRGVTVKSYAGYTAGINAASKVVVHKAMED